MMVARWLLVAALCVVNISLASAEAPSPALLKDLRERTLAKPHSVGYRQLKWEYVSSAGEKRAREIYLWYPTSAKEQKHNYSTQVGLAAKDGEVESGTHPLVVFSHGYLGSADQSIFLTESLARAGYIVVAVNHADSLANGFRERRPPPQFEQYAKWTDDKYRDRHDDLVALLDQLLKWNKDTTSAWAGRIEPEAIGGMGHSLGGYSIMGLAGGWKSWHDERINAAVLLSPFAHPYADHGDKVTIPVMLQGGTLDFAITPFLPKMYDKLGGAKTHVVFKNENHLGWTNFASVGKTTTAAAAAGNPALMVKFSTAFLNEHLLAAASQPLTAEGKRQVDEYRRAEPKQPPVKP